MHTATHPTSESVRRSTRPQDRRPAHQPCSTVVLYQLQLDTVMYRLQPATCSFEFVTQKRSGISGRVPHNDRPAKAIKAMGIAQRPGKELNAALIGRVVYNAHKDSVRTVRALLLSHHLAVPHAWSPADAPPTRIQCRMPFADAAAKMTTSKCALDARKQANCAAIAYLLVQVLSCPCQGRHYLLCCALLYPPSQRMSMGSNN